VRLIAAPFVKASVKSPKNDARDAEAICEAVSRPTIISGGSGNIAGGLASSVSGGLNRTAEGEFDWVAGPLFADF
jgi:hypothetical protein